MRRQLKDASNEKVAAALDGLVADYVEKRDRRARVLELAAREIMQAPAGADAVSFLDDDWMAFFKGKVDHLGTDEAKLFFGKVLAGEVKQPGSFSKRSLSILAEMGPRVGHLFDALCNISTVVSARHVRVVTLGVGDVEKQPAGLGYHSRLSITLSRRGSSSRNTTRLLTCLLPRQDDRSSWAETFTGYT
jgi:hypothetical protein